MSLTPGASFGPYQILFALGAGGMGEVWRARDTRLDRDIAIKALPEAISHDAERLARFEREAKLLASLNHPHIAAIYGVEEADGVRALVLELVEGPTLAQRIAHGPIPLEEALPIARQMADAVEYAHEHGIIHRDLKPANIKLSVEGNVKVLDFGLAKAFKRELFSGPSPVPSDLPTLTRQAMEPGVILGTAAYMSPEQAQGKAVDKRTDIWAFGVVLFEMLTGRRLFAGETISDTLSAVLRDQIDCDTLPANLPATLRTLMRRCLERDRR